MLIYTWLHAGAVRNTWYELLDLHLQNVTPPCSLLYPLELGHVSPLKKGEKRTTLGQNKERGGVSCHSSLEAQHCVDCSPSLLQLLHPHSCFLASGSATYSTQETSVLHVLHQRLLHTTQTLSCLVFLALADD